VLGWVSRAEPNQVHGARIDVTPTQTLGSHNGVWVRVAVGSRLLPAVYFSQAKGAEFYWKNEGPLGKNVTWISSFLLPLSGDSWFLDYKISKHKI